MPRRNLFWLLGISLISIFGLAVSYSAPPREKAQDYELVRLLVDVLYEVRSKYAEKLDPEREKQLVEDMINGGLERLDAHSQYINPRDYEQFNKHSEGQFGGVGIQVTLDPRKGGRLTVISPMAGTPAYRAGVRAGDVILKVDGKSTENMRMSEAVELIQGKPDSDVVLNVLHEGEDKPVDITVTRAIIKIHSVLGDRRDPENPEQWLFRLKDHPEIGFVRLTGFSRTAAQELGDVVQQLKNDGMRGLILDLRNNPGGLLTASVKISNLFLTRGKIVTVKGRIRKEQVYQASPKGTVLPEGANEIPMVVLVNRYSASASEIVAAALQDHKRATIIGERTYGKGSVQHIIELDNGGVLKLTTASYWRPSGKNIHRSPMSSKTDEWGVKPNPGFEVKLSSEEHRNYMIDRRKRDIIRTTPQKDKKKGKKVEPFKDRVIEKAVEHLKKQMEKGQAALLLQPHSA